MKFQVRIAYKAICPGVLEVIVAAGPFTTQNDLHYEPLRNLIELCKLAKPDLLLLMGPFLDAENSQVKTGQLDQAFQSFYEESVSKTVWPTKLHCSPAESKAVEDSRDPRSI